MVPTCVMQLVSSPWGVGVLEKFRVAVVSATLVQSTIACDELHVMLL